MSAYPFRTLTALLVIITCGACAMGIAPAGKFMVPDGVETIVHAQVKMRDGVRLDATVLKPGRNNGPWPTLLVRTPYRSELDAAGSFFRRLLEKGYVIVQEHDRGRFLSEGQLAMLRHAAEDGWDTLDWIAAQPWSDGTVATYGCSSSAENQLKLASLNHPAHKAMIAYSAGVAVAEIGPFREQGNFWRGGVWQQGWFNYFIGETQTKWPQLPSGLSDEERQRASATFRIETSDPFTPDDYARVRLHLPMIEMDRALGAAETEIRSYLSRGPVDASWSLDRVIDTDQIRVPGLWAEALYDISARSTVAFFEKTRRENPVGQQAIVIVNGQHCAFGHETATQHIGDRPIGDARFDYETRQIAWLDRWLKGDQSAPRPAHPVTVYLAGANRWVEFDDVPWAGRDPSRTFFLSGGGSANTLTGDGQLVRDAPPVVVVGGEISGMGPDQRDGAFDQRVIESRPDVLVYTSAPLTEDLAVFGYIETELFVASDAPDTDFTVKLVDVAPDGTAWNIADSIQRMRYREGEAQALFMAAGAVYRIAPPPMLAANVFLAGHRVRLEISSSNFPSYARNLNTTADPYTSTETRVAANQVHHGGLHPSKLVLPVVTLAPR
jgi:putative CocE/NonD family hydrolase